MHYRGEQLLKILQGQTDPVKLFDGAFRLLGVVAPAEAVKWLDRLPVGVGNGRRIRELRPAECIGWTGGSRTTRLVRSYNADGEAVSGPNIREHKPLVTVRRGGQLR